MLMDLASSKSWVHGILTLLNPQPLGFPATWDNPPPSPPTVAQSISPPGDLGSWPFKRSELSGCCQIYGYYIHLQ